MRGALKRLLRAIAVAAGVGRKGRGATVRHTAIGGTGLAQPGRTLGPQPASRRRRPRAAVARRSSVPRLLGAETEYAVADLTGPVAGGGRGLANALVKTAIAERPSIKPFLANGGKLYVDRGLHPEFATPECGDPSEVLRYMRAGDRILSTAAERLQVARRFGRPIVLRTNVDYGGDGNTWGCHESYLHRGVQLTTAARHLIPHLVSRVVFTGAGGFDPLSNGLRFSLSPRSAYIDNAVSRYTMYGRGIFNTRNEALSDARYGRLHVICGESLCSDWATWLKLGTTALVVALIEAHDAPGVDVQLSDPVAMLHTVAADPKCEALLQLTEGRYATALDIQRQYLSRCERRLGDPIMPGWAELLCADWRATLDRIANDPDDAATSLDWAIKRRIYARRAERLGFPSTTWRAWTTVIDALRRGAGTTPITARAILGRSSPVRHLVRDLTPYMRDAGLHWSQLDAFLALRQELFEIDTRFGQLGGDGVFERLDARGLLSHQVDGVGDVAAAVDEPPADGRARVRARFVRDHAGDAGFAVDWHEIVDKRDPARRIDLSDPFASRAAWRKARREPAA